MNQHIAFQTSLVKLGENVGLDTSYHILNMHIGCMMKSLVGHRQAVAAGCRFTAGVKRGSEREKNLLLVSIITFSCVLFACCIS